MTVHVTSVLSFCGEMTARKDGNIINADTSSYLPRLLMQSRHKNKDKPRIAARVMRGFSF